MSLHNRTTVESTLDGIVRAAVGTVPGAEHAGMSVVGGRRRVHTPAATSDLVLALDRAQYETGEGPCLTALYDAPVVQMPDVRTDGRWPAFSAAVADLPLGSTLSFQLYVREADLGALNLYSSRPRAFDEQSVQVGAVFARHASIALAGARTHDQLTHALSARDVIGQAKGILMERFRITGDEAFRVLVHASQQRNVKLLEVARTLVETGEIPVDAGVVSPRV